MSRQEVQGAGWTQAEPAGLSRMRLPEVPTERHSSPFSWLRSPPSGHAASTCMW